MIWNRWFDGPNTSTYYIGLLTPCVTYCAFDFQGQFMNLLSWVYSEWEHQHVMHCASHHQNLYSLQYIP